MQAKIEVLMKFRCNEYNMEFKKNELFYFIKVSY